MTGETPPKAGSRRRDSPGPEAATEADDAAARNRGHRLLAQSTNRLPPSAAVALRSGTDSPLSASTGIESPVGAPPAGSCPSGSAGTGHRHRRLLHLLGLKSTAFAWNAPASALVLSAIVCAPALWVEAALFMGRRSLGEPALRLAALVVLVVDLSVSFCACRRSRHRRYPPGYIGSATTSESSRETFLILSPCFLARIARLVKPLAQLVDRISGIPAASAILPSGPGRNPNSSDTSSIPPNRVLVAPRTESTGGERRS